MFVFDNRHNSIDTIELMCCHLGAWYNAGDYFFFLKKKLKNVDYELKLGWISVDRPSTD
jgi:hypothetical protein